jgi:hypothetical protein
LSRDCKNPFCREASQQFDETTNSSQKKTLKQDGISIESALTHPAAASIII